MKQTLSQKERDILGVASLQADVSIPELAKQSGYQEHIVRRTIAGLRDSGIITPVCQMNPYALGYTEYTVSFAVANDESLCLALANKLKRSREIFYAHENGSHYRYSASILARSPKDVARVLEGILTGLPRGIDESRVSICHAFYLATPHLFTRKKVKVPFTCYEDTGKRVAVDELDIRILRALSKDALLTLRDLSRQVQEAPTTVDYRRKELEKKGVIVGYQYFINYALLGYSMFPAQISLRQISQTTHRKLLDFALSHPLVSYLCFMLGNHDAELGVKVEGSEGISNFLSDLYRVMGDAIGKVTLTPSIKTIKLEYYPFENLS